MLSSLTQCKQLILRVSGPTLSSLRTFIVRSLWPAVDGIVSLNVSQSRRNNIYSLRNYIETSTYAKVFDNHLKINTSSVCIERSKVR